jgi:hypothetical protein
LDPRLREKKVADLVAGARLAPASAMPACDQDELDEAPGPEA